MVIALSPRSPLALGALLLGLGACGAGDGDPPGESPPPPRYVHEMVFVGVRADTPVVVPFSFSAVPGQAATARTARAWLGRGGIWERFLDERWSSPPGGGAWRILPHAGVRVFAGGPTEVEGIAFARGERALRVHLLDTLSSWTRGGDGRARTFDGRLRLGGESVGGTVVELLRMERDGGPRTEVDGMLLTDGGALRLLAAAGGAETATLWLSTGDVSRAADGEVEWVAMRALRGARREVPYGWRVRAPELGVVGEVQALGHDMIREERGAATWTEVRYTVSGWLEVDGERKAVSGAAWHVRR